MGARNAGRGRVRERERERGGAVGSVGALTETCVHGGGTDRR
jgi:hypothetical protein